MILTTILKRKTSWKRKKITVINLFSDESALSSKPDIDEIVIIHSDKNESF